MSAGQWAQVLAQCAASNEEFSGFRLLHSHQSAVMFKAIAILGCIHKWLAPCRTEITVLSLFFRYSQTTPLHLVQFTSDFQKVTFSEGHRETGAVVRGESPGRRGPINVLHEEKRKGI